MSVITVVGVRADKDGLASTTELVQGATRPELRQRTWSSPGTRYRRNQPSEILIDAEHDPTNVIGRVVYLERDALARTIITCPTGALHFRRLDGGPQEEAAAETTVEPRPNGPLFFRGRLKIIDDAGSVMREDTRLALCRCGASKNKPFCDGSNRRNGFTTAPVGAGGDDEAGTSPGSSSVM